ncbi:MAG TPA: PfkB family carbohydrate kinase [Mesorhizobium sp.]|jgi:sugar/nucleoside kinase (ribokinase family)|nr:PfkB family carbohydrate kinase [Mesorhizobium sp.]
MSRPVLLHMGGAVVDLVHWIPALPLPGAESTADGFVALPGGGFNAMLAARRAGLDVVYGGGHGVGPNGDLLRRAFAAEGLGVLLPASPERDSGHCVVLVTPDGERTFVTWPGAEAHLDAAWLSAYRPPTGSWVFLSGYTMSYEESRIEIATWLEGLSPQHPVIFDPSTVVGDIPSYLIDRALARTTWLTLNAREGEALAGPGSPEAVTRRLLGKCSRAHGVVLRVGAGGAHLRLRDGTFTSVPGFAVEAVDTNGAGDTHGGFLAAGLMRGTDPVAAVRLANAAAAISVTRKGGAAAPTRDELAAFLRARGEEETQLEHHSGGLSA